MKTTEAKASTTNTILAIIADRLGTIETLLSGQKVPSVLEALYDIQREEKRVKGFHSGDAFQDAWQAINEE